MGESYDHTHMGKSEDKLQELPLSPTIQVLGLRWSGVAASLLAEPSCRLCSSFLNDEAKQRASRYKVFLITTN